MRIESTYRINVQGAKVEVVIVIWNKLDYRINKLIYESQLGPLGKTIAIYGRKMRFKQIQQIENQRNNNNINKKFPQENNTVYRTTRIAINF